MIRNNDHPSRFGNSGPFKLAQSNVEVEVAQHCFDKIEAGQVGVVLFKLLKSLLVKQQA